MIKPTTVRLIISLAITHGWSLRQLDVNNAFLHGTLHEEVFMSQPPGFIDPQRPHHVYRLKKALYGLKQAPRAWYHKLRRFLLFTEFVNSKADTSLFILKHMHLTIYVLVYVDDLIITRNDTVAIQNFITKLADRFSLKDLGPLSYFLGVEVIPTTNGVFLSQCQYIHDLLVKANMSHAKDVTSPMSPNQVPFLHDGTSLTNATTYRSIVGGLQYLSLTRPDVAFAVNKLSQFMHCPMTGHWSAVKRLLRYLHGTLNHGLYFRKSSPLSLHAFSDADWAGNIDDRTSTSAYVVFLGSNAISWSSKKQKSVARSSTEAEYRVVASTTSEIAWIQSLLQELAISPTSTPTIYCDNVGTTYLCANPVFHSRMKHIAIDFHFVREKVQNGSLRVSHVSSNDQLADALTKPLPHLRLNGLRIKIGVHSLNSILRGHNRESHTKSTL